MKRFLMQESEKPNHYVVTDQTNGIVIVFESKKFNETQEITELKNINPDDHMLLTRQLREVGEWLLMNHKDKI